MSGETIVESMLKVNYKEKTQEYNKLREEELILKAAKSGGANKSEMLHGSLFVTFTPGFVDVLSQELKYVLEKLLDNTTVKMYNIN